MLVALFFLLRLLSTAKSADICVFSTGHPDDPQERCSLWIYEKYWEGQTLHVTTNLEITEDKLVEVDLGLEDPFEYESETNKHVIVKRVPVDVAMEALKQYVAKYKCTALVLSGHASAMQGPDGLESGLRWEDLVVDGLSNNAIVATFPDIELYFTMCGCSVAGDKVKFCSAGTVVPLMITQATVPKYGFYCGAIGGEGYYRVTVHADELRTSKKWDCKDVFNGLLKAVPDMKQTGKFKNLDGSSLAVKVTNYASLENAFMEQADQVHVHKKALTKLRSLRSRPRSIVSSSN